MTRPPPNRRMILVIQEWNMEYLSTMHVYLEQMPPTSETQNQEFLHLEKLDLDHFKDLIIFFMNNSCKCFNKRYKLHIAGLTVRM